MEYETAYIGEAQTSQKQKAAAPAQKRRTVPAFPIKKERRRRGACRPPEISPAGTAAYGFLKTRFLPHYAGESSSHDPKEQERFYHCFGLLCSHYGINPFDTAKLDYPYGQLAALHEADRLLGEKLKQQVSLSFEKENGNFMLYAAERFDTQNTLFYIPVLPLHQMLQNRSRRKSARLLLCIFAYLYREAGVPFYRNEDSYLYWQYDMLSEWVASEPEEWGEDFACFNSQVNAAVHIGETMLRRLYSNVHLENFGSWLSGFVPQNEFDRQCFSLSKRFYALRQDFPDAHIYAHADSECLPDPEEYDDTDCITMEKYIGFVASTYGWLYNQVEQAVNSDFNECSAMQEPVLRHCFGGQPHNGGSLDYECRLFPLINELCYLLNNYDDEP
ncbi:hypothetical protein [Flavobacterium sp. fv08]|uniref:hypothetical protein n=1 Tax=Flavobacterium sp. fv08 TaxID=1761784 RepID=UPI0008AFA2E3|nr:hypothetical protein [Flavobacterium sp. fv08]SEP05726.1 hypothetical protein SAMN04487978_4335 [Flavobacterium sp. fv08]